VNNTLIKGLALLELLVHSRVPLGISELSRTLGIGKSNAHRLAQALTELGYLHKDTVEGSYRASLRMWELGNALMANLDLPRIAAPHLRSLLERWQETVCLAMLEGDDVIYVDILHSPQPVRANLERGSHRACWTTSSGKAILAWQDEARLEALSRRLRAFTEYTIAKSDAFLKEMAKVRSNGYATAKDENRLGLSGVSVPIFDSAGTPIAAIGVLGPSDRLRPAQVKVIVPDVAAAAKAIQRAMSGEQQTAKALRPRGRTSRSQTDRRTG
jgi:IclR family KDG regulon transcriptional repressor